MDENKELPPIIPLPEGRRIKDMTGEKHGMLTCLGFIGQSKRGQGMFVFSCECDKKIVSLGWNVRSGHTKSCGCHQRATGKANGEKLFKDLSGRTFNGIEIDSRAENRGGQTAYNCICHCGERFVSVGRDIKTGHTKSCGCSKTKSTAEFIKEAIAVHGFFYDYTETVYVNSKTKVKIICPKYGVFWQLPSAHLRGQGHPKESRGVKDGQAKHFPNDAQVIYRISFELDGKTVYKVGLTNSKKTLKGRIRALKYDFKSSEPRILSLHGGTLERCFSAEQFIKAKMVGFSIERPEGTPGGWTECFSVPIPSELWREATKNLTPVEI